MTPDPDNGSQTASHSPVGSERIRGHDAPPGWRMAGRAALAIVVLWGGIIVTAAIEQRLPDDQMWLGHATVHVWTAIIAGLIATVALRLSRCGPTGVLTALVRITAIVATVTSVSAALEVAGAYPTLRRYHDLVDTIGEPAGWLLLGALLAVVGVGLLNTRHSPGVQPESRDSA